MRTTAELDGVLLLDKPAGLTSHDVVAVTRRALGVRRIGHTGTLDPFATGLLVLLVGRATRLLPYVDGEPKVYEAKISFGAETTTDDCTGDETFRAPLPTRDAVAKAIHELTGPLKQRPPDYSAKQVAGVRAYAAARAGRPLALAPVDVVIHSWEVRSLTEQQLDAIVACTGGTYVRALARDLGRAAGSAAHLTGLRRVQVGAFHIRQALSLDAVQRGGAVPAPLRTAVPHLPTQSLSAVELERVQHGQSIEARVVTSPVVLVDHDECVVALAERRGDALFPRVVLRDA